MPAAAPARRHFPLLDVARCVAISMVIVHHVGFRFADLVPDIVGRFFWGVGWAGVDVFFVISGFLITDILMRSSGVHATRAFFVNRAFRIIPLYAAAVTLYVLVASARGTDRDLSQIWWSALFLTGWAIPFVGVEHVPYTITWSLSVEESAYVLFAIVAGLWRARLPAMLWATVVVSFALRALLVSTGTFGPNEVYYFPPTRIDSIAFGGLIAVGVIKAGARYRFLAAMAGVAGVFLWFFAKGQYNATVAILGYTALPVAVAYLCAHLIQRVHMPQRIPRLLAHIGQRSYFIYLFHVFVIGALSLPYFRPFASAVGFWGTSVAVLAVTLALAEVSWRFFEYPLIRFGRDLSSRVNPAIEFRRPV